jgi:hypothetical protein
VRKKRTVFPSDPRTPPLIFLRAGRTVFEISKDWDARVIDGVPTAEGKLGRKRSRNAYLFPRPLNLLLV